MDTNFVFLLASVIIIAGFLGDRFFRRTGVAPFLFLILIGVILGPVFHVLSSDSFVPILGVFGQLTLSMILFYAGMDISLASLKSTGWRVVLQVVLYVIPSVIVVTGVTMFLLRWDLIQSLIFASMVGGETTAVIAGTFGRTLGVSEDAVGFLTTEAALNSILLTVLFFSFVGMYQSGVVEYSSALSVIVSNFSVSVIIGLALSVIWLRLLRRYSAQKYTYVLTLALLLLTYVTASELGGTGALGALVFGIVLGNSGAVGDAMGWRINIEGIMQQLKSFQDEISFLLRTLFFVFLGLAILIDPRNLLFDITVGLVLLGILFTLRAAAITVSTHRTNMVPENQAMLFFMAQGLTPATLAILAYSMALPLSGTYLILVTFVIVFTNAVTTVGAYLRAKEKEKSFRNFMWGLGDGVAKSGAQAPGKEG